MKRLILEPLHKDYVAIRITATDLAEPFQWKTTPEKQEENFERGDILHSVLLNGLLCKEKTKYVLMFYAEDIDSKKMDRLRAAVRNSVDLPELLMIEQKKRIKIEYGKYLLMLTGKFDGLFISPEKGVTLVDIKSARNAVAYEEKIQLKIYGFLNNIANIEYWVYPKTKNPKPVIHSFELNLEQNKKVVIKKIIDHVEEKYGYVNKDIKRQFIL